MCETAEMFMKWVKTGNERNPELCIILRVESQEMSFNYFEGYFATFLPVLTVQKHSILRFNYLFKSFFLQFNFVKVA